MGDFHMRHLLLMRLLLFLVAPSSWGQEQPKQDGKTAAQWAKDLQSKDSFEREKAAGALAQLGAGAKDAVPALIARLKDESGEVRYWSALALGQIAPEADGVFDAAKSMVKDPKVGP